MKKIILLPSLVLLFLLANCSLPEKVEIQPYVLKERDYAQDKVSVQTSIDLAKQAYVLGCVRNKIVLKSNYQECLKRGQNYIENDVLPILDQRGKEKSLSRGSSQSN